MMSVDTVTIIGGIVAMVIAVSTPILKLNNTLTVVSTKLEEVAQRISGLEGKRRDDNQKIWSTLNDHTEKLSDIKTDLTEVKVKIEERRD